MVPCARVLELAAGRCRPRRLATPGWRPCNRALPLPARPPGCTVRATGPRLILFSCPIALGGHSGVCVLAVRWGGFRSPPSRRGNCDCRRCGGLPVERVPWLATIYFCKVEQWGGGGEEGGASCAWVCAWSMAELPASSHLPLPRSTCVPGPVATFGSGCFLCTALVTRSTTTCGDCCGRFPEALCLPPSLSLFLTVPAPARPTPHPPPLAT